MFRLSFLRDAGDTIKARCHPLRDGSNGCLLGFLKAPDGTVKDWDGNNAPNPAPACQPRRFDAKSRAGAGLGRSIALIEKRRRGNAP